jgi:Cdc6-like AAA superfamily ATPase
MHSDPNRKFREILQKDLPAFVDRVDSPWDDLPDDSDYNASAYRQIVRELDRLRNSAKNGRPASKGILILGETGTGKTHLLMRVAHNLAKSNHILFVRKPNDEESVAQHVWVNILNSLSYDLSTNGRDRNQLDDMLAHVFSRVLIPEFEQDAKTSKGASRKQQWAELLRADPYNLFNMLGEGEGRTANMRSIRSRTLRFLQRVHPDVDQQIAHALISYCFVSSETRRRVLLNWLSGQEIDEREAQAAGLPRAWITVDETSSEVSLQQRQEEQALRAIQTIGILSTQYQPLVLAFDQLEGLRNEERLTQRWGDVLREIFTMSPNFLIVTCIYPSLWNDWFQGNLDESVQQRISQSQVKLEAFQPKHGRRLLEKQLEAIRSTHSLPTSTYPFTELDVAELCAQATSPRLFIQAAHAAFDRWLDEDFDASDDASEFAAEVSLGSPSLDADVVLLDALQKFEAKQLATYGTDIATEQDMLGRIRFLLRAILRGQTVDYAKARWGHFVMPPNMVLRSQAYGDNVCIACLNSAGRSFTARIRNLTAAMRDGEEIQNAILVRDCRCAPATARADEHLEVFKRHKGQYLILTAEECILLSALYDLLVAIEERNVSIGGCNMEVEHFQEFLVRSGVYRRSMLLRALCTAADCVEHALGRVTPGTTLPEAGEESEIDDLRLDACLDRLEESSHNADYGQDDLSLQDALLSGVRDVQTAVALATETRTGDCQVLERPELPAPAASRAIQVREKFFGVQALIGDCELDSQHIGVVGQLQDSQQTLGISLSKPQCMVLLGYMGSGKSYALGVLLENALQSNSRLVQSARPMTVVAFNYRRNPSARFEYHGFAQPNATERELELLSARYGATPAGISKLNVFGYEPELKRRQADYHDLPQFPIKFRPEELGAEHWTMLMKPPTPQAEYMEVMRDIIQDLYYQDRLTAKHLEKAVLNDDRLSDSQRRRAMNRMSFVARWLAEDRAYEWSEVLSEGTMNVFDLRMQTLTKDEALKLCLVITDLARRTRNGVNKLVVFDEAHEYVDSKELIDELENSITQIRHDGMSFILASQFPERIPERIFKYLTTRFIFKLPTANAINYLKKAAPNLKTLSLKQVANLGLEKGLCLVQSDEDRTDPSLGTPQLLQVRPRLSQHGGATLKHIQPKVAIVT